MANKRQPLKSNHFSQLMNLLLGNDHFKSMKLRKNPDNLNQLKLKMKINIITDYIKIRGFVF